MQRAIHPSLLQLGFDYILYTNMLQWGLMC